MSTSYYLDEIKEGIYTADFSDIPLVNLLRSIVYPEDEDDSDHGAQLENLQSTSSEPNNSRIEVSVLIHSDVNFRQSKEIFSRHKFNAIELQTKLKFLDLLYEESQAPSSEVLSAPSPFKGPLKAKKSEVDSCKKNIRTSIEESLVLYNDLLNEKDVIQKELEALELLEQECAELETLKFPVVKRTIEEATAHFEGQVLTAEDLQISLQSLNDLLTEGGKRFSREVALLQDLDHEIFTLNEQLTQQKKENTIKDQTSKELFAYYETYSTIIHQVFGIQLEFIVPPTKLMKECSGIIHALFEELPEQLIALYFSISCSLLQVKIGDNLLDTVDLLKLQEHFEETKSIYSLLLAVKSSLVV